MNVFWIAAIYYNSGKVIKMSKKTNTVNILFNLLVATAVVSSLVKTPDHQSNVSLAYLDPGTGSMIISAIVAIFATIALGVKTFWYKIVRIFNPSKKTPETKKTSGAKK
jgi:hypothetical protein